MRNLLYVITASVLLCLPQALTAQNAPYWIFFTDKQGVEFDPLSYFDAHTVEKRMRQGIDLDQFSDRPVRKDYLQQVASIVDSVGYASRWLNAVGVKCSPDDASTISTLPFVSEVLPVLSEMRLAGTDYDTATSTRLRERMYGQLSSLGRDAMIEAGLNGKGVRIAIFDAGFSGADIAPAFRHIFDRGGVIKTWDFKKNNEFVYHGHSHGTMVWSCIAGRSGDLQSGLATEAEFLLARTEGRGEPFSEEMNWIAALEWADKNGADIINSSLGYTYHRYFPEQMDGRTAPVSRAAAMAASKGILVVNAAGNEGIGSWKKLGAPADADSILTVGGIEPATGYHTSFSSYGPASDGRIKPNVTAFGWVSAAGPTKWTLTQGTSFASPLVAGFAACARQVHPEMPVMDLLRLVEKSASLYPYYDYAHGYGVPQAERLLGKWDAASFPELFSLVEIGEGKIGVKISQADVEMPFRYPGDQYLYCHIRDADGRVLRYLVVDPLDTESGVDAPLDAESSTYEVPWTLKGGDVAAFYFKGVYKEYKP